MNYSQLIASIMFSRATLVDAIDILARIESEPSPLGLYYQERLNSARQLVEDIKAHIARLEDLARKLESKYPYFLTVSK